MESNIKVDDKTSPLKDWINLFQMGVWYGAHWYQEGFEKWQDKSY